MQRPDSKRRPCLVLRTKSMTFFIDSMIDLVIDLMIINLTLNLTTVSILAAGVFHRFAAATVTFSGR